MTVPARHSLALQHVFWRFGMILEGETVASRLLCSLFVPELLVLQSLMLRTDCVIFSGLLSCAFVHQNGDAETAQGRCPTELHTGFEIIEISDPQGLRTQKGLKRLENEYYVRELPKRL